MRMRRVYAGDDGESRLDEIEIDLMEDDPSDSERRFQWSDPERPIPFSDPWVARQMNLWRCPAEHPDGWHNPPERVFLIILTGRAEIEVSTGEQFVLGPGDMALFEDTGGGGHRFGPAGDEDVVGVVLSVTEDSPQRHG